MSPALRVDAVYNQRPPSEEGSLVRVERSAGKHQYFFSNLPADATREQLVGLIEARLICERPHQQMRDELDPDPFEGRF